MLKKLTVPALLLVAGFCKAQVKPAAYNNNTTLNSVRTWDVKVPVTNPVGIPSMSISEVVQTAVYTDALGRPIETIVRKGSLNSSTNSNKDLVSSMYYDDVLGVEIHKFLPFVSNTDNGEFKYDPFEEQKVFYDNQLYGQGETFYYGKTDIEKSPLMRPAKVYAPGNSWVAGNKGIATSYLNNTQTADDVKIWTVNGSSNYTVNSLPYQDGQLIETHTTDEQQHQVVEYKDKDGKVILKKVQVDNVIGDSYTGWLCTYYVYDNYNSLRLVIPPKAVKWLIGHNWTLNSSIINELCFRYEYDGKDRMVIKKVPGAAEVYMIYDKWDRLVLTQDGNLRSSNKWVFTKYDYLGRPVITGLFTDASHIGQTNMQDYVNSLYTSTAEAPFESANGSSSGYTTTVSFPSLSSPQLLTITFYDNYDWATAFGTEYGGKDNSNDAMFYPGGSPLYAQPLTASNKTKGMVTGTVTFILNSSTGEKLVSSVFYDDKGRPIQSKASNYGTGIDISTTQYNFTGQPLMNVLQHKKNAASAATKVITKTNYDVLGRLVQVKKQVIHIGGVQTPERILVANEYDALGQLKTKILAPEFNSNTGLEKLNYDYNVRGWLLGMNRDFIKDLSPSSYFGFELGYDKPGTAVSGSFYTTPQYNGNIEGTIWKSKGDNEKRKYDFTYDNVNRLMSADFNQYTGGYFNRNANVDFSIKMGNNGSDYSKAYDENGNILRMQQWGLKINASEKIDDLNYTYYNDNTNGSNKLQNVIDFNNVAATKLGDFRTSGNHVQQVAKTAITNEASFISNQYSIYDYGYDINGNMITDRNKDLSGSVNIDQTTGGAISYNYLNLPWVITVAGKGSITYTYDAAGNKLQKKTIENDITVTYQSSPITTTLTTTTDYIAGFVYESKSYSNTTLNNALGYIVKLQLLSHEEGRLRAAYNNSNEPNLVTGFMFDYMIKDHLGNVRMVLTDEQQVDHYPTATVEANALTQEKTYYDIPNSAVTVVDKPETLLTESATLLDYINDNGTNNPNTFGTPSATSAKMMKLNAAAYKTGMSMVLKVMAGDQLNILAKSYYQYLGTNASNSPLNAGDIISTFLSTGGASNPAIVHGATVPILNNNTTGTVTPINSLLNGNNNTNPYNNVKAGLCYILFDEQFNYAGGGFDPVFANLPGVRGSNGGPEGGLKSHLMQNITVPKNGYIYVYFSNESNINVYFDNLELIHTRGQILEETHYYPFGLTMQGISSKSAGKLENKYGITGKEKQNKEFSDGSGLEVYDFGARHYNPQIGRWHNVDPLSDNYLNYSPYVFCLNNPLRFYDPNGMEVEEVEGGMRYTKEDAKSALLVISGKAKSVYFDVNGKPDQRDEINNPDKKVVYGNWGVFAVKSLYEASSVLDNLKAVLDNLVVANHGNSENGEAMFAIKDKHAATGEGDYISTSEIIGYNQKGGKDLTKGEQDVSVLKSLLGHVKENGNAALVFCFTGSGKTGETTIKELAKLSSNINILLPKGMASTRYFKFTTGRAVNVNTTLSSVPGSGWLQINPSGTVKSVYDVVLNASGAISLKIVATKPK